MSVHCASHPSSRCFSCLPHGLGTPCGDLPLRCRTSSTRPGPRPTSSASWTGPAASRWCEAGRPSQAPSAVGKKCTAAAGLVGSARVAPCNAAAALGVATPAGWCWRCTSWQLGHSAGCAGAIMGRPHLAGLRPPCRRSTPPPPLTSWPGATRRSSTATSRPPTSWSARTMASRWAGRLQCRQAAQLAEGAAASSLICRPSGGLRENKL